MSQEIVSDPLSERRLRELERLARARVAGLLARKAKGQVVMTISLEGGHITWDSGVAVEEKPLTRA
jgi:hypothetical protein